MAKYRDPRVRVARPYAGTKRVLRSPQHPFQLRTRPFQIQPFMLSPVLPGETMKNLVVQSRVVSDPLKHPLIGWWTEYYLFYVKLKDIEFHMQNSFVDEMVTQPGTYDPAPLRSAAANPKYYHAANGTNWTKLCMETVVEYFFRDEAENWDVASLDGLPLAQISGKNWTDSLTLDEDKRTERDVNLDLNDDGDITAQEAMEAQAHWQALRDSGLETLDYEDWLRTFGVNQVREVEESFNLHRPELVRYFKQWTYPTNTVDPVTGVPSSAVSWVNAFRADKDRMFKEPGFLVGLNVTRPKVYLKDTGGQLAHYLETVENFLPALSHAHYEKGFKSFGPTAGPLAGKFKDNGGAAEGYWIDLRDLFIHGDQFLNFVPDDASGALSVITDAGARRYPSAATIDSLFKSPTANQIRQDGIVSLTIAGRQRDTTPGSRL